MFLVLGAAMIIATFVLPAIKWDEWDD